MKVQETATFLLDHGAYRSATVGVNFGARRNGPARALIRTTPRTRW